MSFTATIVASLRFWSSGENGGQSFRFGVPGVCDGMLMGHAGMHYSLPLRELIADAVERVQSRQAAAQALDVSRAVVEVLVEGGEHATAQGGVGIAVGGRDRMDQ
jgi:hypothetical protein